MEITLYSRAWCSWCIDAKEYLTERGYRFTEIDVGKDREAYDDMLELSEQTYVPTLVAGDEVQVLGGNTGSVIAAWPLPPP